MQAWPIQDAKARFSEFLETCLAEGPQMVTKRGSEAAVQIADWVARTFSPRTVGGTVVYDLTS